jgi:2-polyprenyl-3-methyl-5-hydroxy-6-metoxy-1,4-benzoquinol methylase
LATTHYDETYFVRQLSKSDAKLNWHYGRVFALAGVAPSGRVLDIGCGAGPGLRYFAARGARAAGVDLVHYPLVESQRLVPGALLAQGDVGRNLPFADASFDLLLLSELVEHIADERPPLAECHRVLRPGGAVVVTTPNLWDIRRALAPITGRIWSGDTDPTHCNLFTPPRLGRALRAAGFIQVRWRTGIKPMGWLSSRRLRMRLALPYPPLVGNGLLAVGRRRREIRD